MTFRQHTTATENKTNLLSDSESIRFDQHFATSIKISSMWTLFVDNNFITTIFIYISKQLGAFNRQQSLNDSRYRESKFLRLMTLAAYSKSALLLSLVSSNLKVNGQKNPFIMTPILTIRLICRDCSIKFGFHINLQEI